MSKCPFSIPVVGELRFVVVNNDDQHPVVVFIPGYDVFVAGHQLEHNRSVKLNNVRNIELNYQCYFIDDHRPIDDSFSHPELQYAAWWRRRYHHPVHDEDLGHPDGVIYGGGRLFQRVSST
ncbi:hypothetical protein HMN09_01068600 [Mycena chlorophos]|uniref:Uncharacterized protein n=1 Tax=Mycena chlorophos TaxID=658473 RepID=A0A8H6VWI3_MYCCL|nr:hypothetical protein HMN09_01068600 [Mycena chlorophos]